jgi:hypothetical protein
MSPIQNWTIAVPVFGREYAEKFFDITLPRVAECLEGFANINRRVSWVIHTDRIADVNKRIPGATCIKALEPLDYPSFVEGHKEVWEKTPVGEPIVFLCADLVPSKTAFFFAAEALERGKQVVMCAGIRTYAPEPPRIGADTEELLQFSMRYPHKIVSDTFYGPGCSENPTNVYFRDGDSVVLRGFHLHPFVVVKRDTGLVGTVDDDLMEGFDEDEIHVVTNREMALVEMSPLTKSQPEMDRPFTINFMKKVYEQKARGAHKHFLKHQIRILGAGDCGDREAFAAEGLETL